MLRAREIVECKHKAIATHEGNVDISKGKIGVNWTT